MTKALDDDTVGGTQPNSGRFSCENDLVEEDLIPIYRFPYMSLKSSPRKMHQFHGEAEFQAALKKRRDDIIQQEAEAKRALVAMKAEKMVAETRQPSQYDEDRKASDTPQGNEIDADSNYLLTNSLESEDQKASRSAEPGEASSKPRGKALGAHSNKCVNAASPPSFCKGGEAKSKGCLLPFTFQLPPSNDIIGIKSFSADPYSVGVCKVRDDKSEQAVLKQIRGVKPDKSSDVTDPNLTCNPRDFEEIEKNDKIYGADLVGMANNDKNRITVDVTKASHRFVPLINALKAISIQPLESDPSSTGLVEENKPNLRLKPKSDKWAVPEMVIVPIKPRKLGTTALGLSEERSQYIDAGGVMKTGKIHSRDEEEAAFWKVTPLTYQSRKSEDGREPDWEERDVTRITKPMTMFAINQTVSSTCCYPSFNECDHSGEMKMTSTNGFVIDSGTQTARATVSNEQYSAPSCTESTTLNDSVFQPINLISGVLASKESHEQPSAPSDAPRERWIAESTSIPLANGQASISTTATALLLCSKRKLILIAILVLTIIGGAIAGISISRGGGGKGEADEVVLSKKDFIEDSSRDFSVNPPTRLPIPTSRYDAILSALTSTVVTTLGDLALKELVMPGSPQNNALLWLINDDHGSADLYFAELAERYAVATLYFATNGEYWINNTNFLLPGVHVCNWNMESEEYGTDFPFKGVFCLKNNVTVDDVTLRELTLLKMTNISFIVSCASSSIFSIHQIILSSFVVLLPLLNP